MQFAVLSKILKICSLTTLSHWIVSNETGFKSPTFLGALKGIAALARFKRRHSCDVALRRIDSGIFKSVLDNAPQRPLKRARPLPADIHENTACLKSPRRGLYWDEDGLLYREGIFCRAGLGAAHLSQHLSR